MLWEHSPRQVFSQLFQVSPDFYKTVLKISIIVIIMETRKCNGYLQAWLVGFSVILYLLKFFNFQLIQLSILLLPI